jgi:glycine/serine hydroxymethyltransferase
MDTAEMGEIATLIARALRHRDDDNVLDEVRADVNVLCGKYPPYTTL